MTTSDKDLNDILERKLKDGASRRKLAGYGASYLRDRLRAADFPEKEKPMLQRMQRILAALGEHGLDDVTDVITDQAPETVQQCIDRLVEDDGTREKMQERLAMAMQEVGQVPRPSLGWKVPFRQVYCATFKDWLRSTFWCLVVIKVFPQAVNLASDALVQFYLKKPEMFFEQYEHRLLEIDRDVRNANGGEWPAPPPGCA
jgi:hypothetical protein